MKLAAIQDFFSVFALFFCDQLIQYAVLSLGKPKDFFIHSSFFSRAIPSYFLAALVFFLILIFTWWTSRIYRLERYPFGCVLIIAGALSNMWDRIVLGGVFDWIMVRGFFSFNISDVMIVIGILLLLKKSHQQKC